MAIATDEAKTRGAAPGPAEPASRTRKKKGVVRENVESFAVAIAAALIIRWIVIEPFKIPTGSMAPTLLGKHRSIKCHNCGYRFKLDYKFDVATCSNCLQDIEAFNARLWKGDRILVWKFIYRLSEPQRWDVMVFVYPRADVTCKNCGRLYEDVQWQDMTQCENCGSRRLKRTKKNFIKRVVGMPGERILISGGDVFVNGRIARKPRRVQNALWLPMYTMSLAPKEKHFEPWRPKDGQWKIEPHKLTCAAKPGQRAEVEFARTLRDRCAYLGGTVNVDAVRDTRVQFDVKCSNSTQGLTVATGYDKNVFRAIVPLNGKGECQLTRAGKVVSRTPCPVLKPEDKHHVVFAHADATVYLRVDGNEIARFEYEIDPQAHNGYIRTNHISFGADGGEAQFSAIDIDRDVYYVRGGGCQWAVYEELQLGKGEFFVLGDNSPNSKDARMWKCVPRKNLLGKAFAVFWPLTEMAIIR